MDGAGPIIALHLHHPAAPGPRDHRGDPDRDDLPAQRVRRDPTSPPTAARATPAPTSPILIYEQALLHFDVGGASAGGVIAVILANIVAVFLMRIVGKNLEA